MSTTDDPTTDDERTVTQFDDLEAVALRKLLYHCLDLDEDPDEVGPIQAVARLTDRIETLEDRVNTLERDLELAQEDAATTAADDDNSVNKTAEGGDADA